MSEQHKCAGRVWSGSLLGGFRVCNKTARYEHEGKWYCKTHHPPHAEEKRRAAHEKWEAKFDTESAQMEQRERERAEMQRKAAAYDGLLEALKDMLLRDEKNTCRHEETHRGGAIWEICDSCGSMWADDEGGKPEWEDPKEWTQARAAIKAVEGEKR